MFYFVFWNQAFFEKSMLLWYVCSNSKDEKNDAAR